MKRYSIALIVLAALSVSAFVYNLARPAIGQQPRTTRDVSSSRDTADITETPKGKVLVEKLPEGADGVVLEKGVVKAKPGYKFVKKGNSVMVRKAGSGGGFGIGGSWNCNCSAGGGGCEAYSDENAIMCRKTVGSDCSDKCLLSVVIKGVKAQIVQY
jgi:hypothetical protein